MTKLAFAGVTLADLKPLIHLEEKAVADYAWTQVEHLPLSEIEQQQLQAISSRLLNYPLHLMNEATIFARAIYPLLLLSEQNSIQAWAEVGLKAQYAKFELEGIIDAVLAKSIAGRVESPYLVVVETKRGVEGQNPVFQLYAQILAAARFNWENTPTSPQEMFGRYTIADSWTFVRGEIEEIDSDLPTLRVEYSREYVEKLEAETIFKILKGIVAKYAQRNHN
ncbi:MAG: hypothetical protein SW833_12875 [Cyanobacteriota bacterium]|nr:hypothetical protein [Cyanobacteriota bacterium]